MRRAVVAVALGLAVTGVAFAAPEARGSTPAQLLARHAPVIVLHPDERFAPVPVDGFLADSDLQVRGPDGTWQASTASLPEAAVGTVYTSPSDIPRKLREILDHYGHYRGRARAFAGVWNSRSSAEKVVSGLAL